MNKTKSRIFQRVTYAGIFTVGLIFGVIVFTENKELMKLIQVTPALHYGKLVFCYLSIGLFNFYWGYRVNALADNLTEMMLQGGLCVLLTAFVWPKLFPHTIGEQVEKQYWFFHKTITLYDATYQIPFLWYLGAILLIIGHGRVIFSKHLAENKENKA